MKEGFGTRIKSERERVGCTQIDFANIAEITRLTQSKYENGATIPNLDYLQKIEEFGVDIQYIITGENSVYINRDEEFNNYARLAGECVTALEKHIQANPERFSHITPEKKGALVCAIFRASQPGKPINDWHILDLLVISS